MSGPGIVALVAVILVGQAIMLVLVLRGLRRRMAAERSGLAARLHELESSGEDTQIEPTAMSVRSGHVSGLALVALTDRRLVIAGSRRRELELSAIANVEVARSFNGKISGGRRFVILKMADASAPPLALHVRTADADHWAGAIGSVVSNASKSR